MGTTKTNMKLFLIAAVLIASVFAEPESEAKADAWYGAYGYGGYPYAGAYGAYAGAYGLGYNGYAAGYRYLGKRSADSDAESKPWLTYGAGYGYAGYPYAATYGAYAAPVATYAHAAYAAPVATYAGAHLIGKRSADSDAEAKPWLVYSNYGYAGYPYASTYGAYAAQLPPTLMLLILPHTPPMEELTSSARDPLIPNQNPGMELTDTLPHTPHMVDTLPTVHTPTDVTPMADTDTDGKNFTK